ncbi:hypothetical protein SVAN01_10499 [Stagonosporopsis vannaccii]|nr:hypothetical protein SVAN01_10499 [Stagonosporopsis vannaccii]
MSSWILALAILLLNAANALTIGERSYALAPRACRRRKRRTRDYIIAFSLVGAALVAGFAFWFVRRYRRRNSMAKISPVPKEPIVAQQGNSNVWFGSSGLSGR